MKNKHNGKYVNEMRQKQNDKGQNYRMCKSKIRYRNESEALRALKSCKRKRGGYLDVYWCHNCDGWHLTSNDGKEFQWNE